MTKYSKIRFLSLAIGLTLLSTASAQQTAGRASSNSSPASSAESEFQRGYFAQKHDGNFAEAIAAYERVTADQPAPSKLRREAEAQLAACREELVADDLAKLMPPDPLAYLEVTRPGEHVLRLVNMLGLIREPSSATSPAGASALGGGLFFPDDFTISPALVAELKKVHGVAAAITSVDRRGIPEGLLVVHPGNSDLIRGVLETAVQLLQPADPIDGFKTYRDPAQGWIAVTARMFLISRSRDQLTAAFARLRDPKLERLASRSEFQAWQKDRRQALAFVYVNGPQVVQHLNPMLRGREAMIARSALDLEHLDSFVALMGASDDSVLLRTKVSFKPGQHNLAYGLVRTAPLTQRSLAAVPSGAAAVAMLGLNVPGQPADEKATASDGFSAMDIGREVFANIEELAVFALSSSVTAPKQQPIPDVGLVLSVKDPARSEALWNQLLALPALFGAPGAQPVGETTIEGQNGHIYQFPGMPPLVVVRSSRGNIIAGTEAAATASLKALATNTTIASDGSMKPLLERLTTSSSKAVLVDVGRVLQMILPKSERDQQKATLASMIAGDLKLSVITDESSNQLCLTFQAAGLPNVPALIKMTTTNRPVSAPTAVTQK